MRFIIKKNPANKKDVIVILKNTNTGETRKTVVPYGKKKERPLDYGHYVIKKMYQEGVDNKKFEIIPDRPEITLNEQTRTHYDNDIYLTVAENTEYKEEQKRKQEEENKVKAENEQAQAAFAQSTGKGNSNSQSNESQNADDNQNYTVYKTRTGSKYHSSGCRYLKKSCYETTVSQARNEGLTPCSVCNP